MKTAVTQRTPKRGLRPPDVPRPHEEPQYFAAQKTHRITLLHQQVAQQEMGKAPLVPLITKVFKKYLNLLKIL